MIFIRVPIGRLFSALSLCMRLLLHRLCLCTFASCIVMSCCQYLYQCHYPLPQGLPLALSSNSSSKSRARSSKVRIGRSNSHGNEEHQSYTGKMHRIKSTADTCGGKVVGMHTPAHTIIERPTNAYTYMDTYMRTTDPFGRGSAQPHVHTWMYDCINVHSWTATCASVFPSLVMTCTFSTAV